MMRSMQFYLSILLLLSYQRRLATGKLQSLREIHYHYTTCEDTGRFAPSYDSCIEHYRVNDSAIFRDRVFQKPNSSNFDYFQSFRAPRDGFYNITVAGAAGGRGVCSGLYGRGITVSVRVYLTSDIALFFVVGQHGGNPCGGDLSSFQCDPEPPKSLENATRCQERWHEFLTETYGQNIGVTLLERLGGGGGGGATMIRVLRSGDAMLVETPLVVAGGGGGTGITTEDCNAVEACQTYIDGKAENIEGSGKMMDFLNVGQLSPGRGGSYVSGIISDIPRIVDGGNLFLYPNGGDQCDPTVTIIVSSMVGGFGGGGGGCVGGGGGGGFQGGSTSPGAGGTSYLGTFSPSPTLLNYDVNTLSMDGYVDIVAADCGCVYECFIYEGEDNFECLCPNNTHLAPDLRDCYNTDKREVNESEWNMGTTLVRGYRLSLVEFGSSAYIYSMRVTLSNQRDGSEQRAESGGHNACAVVFVDENGDMTLSSEPGMVSEGPIEVMSLSQLQVNFTEGSANMSEFTGFLSSPVLVTGAILVSQGDCFIQGGLSLSISILEPTANNFMAAIRNLEDAIASNALQAEDIIQQILQLSPSNDSNDNGKGISGGYMALIVIFALFVITMVICSALLVWFVLSRHRSKRCKIDRKKGRHSVMSLGRSLTLNMQYATFRKRMHVNGRENYGISISTGRNVHGFSDHVYEEFSSDGYAQLEESEATEAPSDKSSAVLSPQFGIGAPHHDFVQFNRIRCNSTFKTRDWQYPRSGLIYLRDIGEGQFGKVLLMKAMGIAGYSGQLPVAVKTLSSRGPEMVRKFMEEAELMKKFSHQNIVSLLGVCTDDGHNDSAPLIILEYMPHGDLRGFLIKHRPSQMQPTSLLKESHFISFATDVANALDFLARRKYVHRDIAARNCLVGQQLEIKIADFGLARGVLEKCYYKVVGNTVLPIRSMAPESLLYGIFTTASDVWSYGVLLWEIVTFGATPLEGISSQAIVQHAETRSIQHSCPPECPPVLSSLISQCHTHDPDQRPSFTDIFEKLLLQNQ